MRKPSEHKIKNGTERLMKRMPLEKVRLIPKYKNITEEQYFLLIKNVEKITILILESFISAQSSDF